MRHDWKGFEELDLLIWSCLLDCCLHTSSQWVLVRVHILSVLFQVLWTFWVILSSLPLQINILTLFSSLPYLFILLYGNPKVNTFLAFKTLIFNIINPLANPYFLITWFIFANTCTKLRLFIWSFFSFIMLK